MIEAETQTPLAVNQMDTEPDEVRAEVLRGLAKPAKELPCKLFYDKRGSELFERICELDEYYLTRSETVILERAAIEIAELIGPRCMLIEYGSGSGRKTRILLDHLTQPVGYVPIDLSREQLLRSASAIATSYPRLKVLPLHADYTQPLMLPPIAGAVARRVSFFPGSTIGNFLPRETVGFFERVCDVVGPGGGLLIGADLKKDPGLLQLAYNDRAGVTAEFNLNILAHINQLFGSDFRLDRFAHHAHYNELLGRIEMHLISQEHQVVQLDGIEITFQTGERILTEVSYKYSLEQFAALASRGGFDVRRVWTDSGQLFSLHYLVAR